MPLHLLVKWEVVSPNSREGQFGSISIILYSLVLILYLKCGGGLGGGGVMFFSHFMLFPTFLEKKNLGIQNNDVSFNVFFLFFFVCWKYCTYSYWLNGRWFLQIVDIHVGNFNLKLTGRWFPQIVDRDSGNLYPIYI